MDNRDMVSAGMRRKSAPTTMTHTMSLILYTNRMPDSLPALTIGAGLTYDTPATRAGYRVYRITGGSGQITFA